MAAGFPAKANYATGDILTATNMNDLAGTVNLAVSTTPTTATQMAGKNKIINGDFNVWQRGTSFTITGQSYLVDRWLWTGGGSGATRTLTQQTFTPGTAPVTGYEAQYFARYNQSVAGTGSTYNQFQTRLEDVRLFAGQTVTVSFWAKADASRSVDLYIGQNFGSGGSGGVETAFSPSSVTLTTSWVRYSATVTVPSVSGKTIGTGSYLYFYFGMPNNAVFTIDYWGVQLEAGSVATAFQTATGTIQGELAACQRYYYRQTVSTTYGYLAFGMCLSTTGAKMQIPLPVPMRVVPTSMDTPTSSTLRVTDGVTGTTLNGTPTLDSDSANNSITFNVGVASGLTQYRPIFFGANNSASAYVGFSAEL